MKKHFVALILLCFLCGCSFFTAAPEKKEKKSVPPPPPSAAPQKQQPVVKIKPVPAPPPAPQPVVQQPQVKKDKPAPVQVPPERKFRAPENSRPNSVWKVFARLSAQEQQEMIKLQRQNPDKFRLIMQQKAEQFKVLEQARKKELDTLTQKYRDSSSEAEKNAIKLELKKKLQEDFSRRLADSRRSLENNRKRLIRMEAELQKREKNRDAIVEAMLKHRLDGKKMPPPPRHR